jgi:hypothetical protein
LGAIEEKLERAGTEHPNRDPSLRFLQSVRQGEVEACTSTEVLQEILYRYHALGRLDLAGRVYDLFVALILSVTLADTDLARDLLHPRRGPRRETRCTARS